MKSSRKRRRRRRIRRISRWNGNKKLMKNHLYPTFF
jgi:hypothetical protein